MMRPSQPTDLRDFIEHELLPRLDMDGVFNHPAHRFQKSAEKWRGGCPWHDSKSGSSFVVDPRSGDWFCAGCHVGGGVVQYLHRCQGGDGQPRGREFIDLLKQVCDLAGISFPEPNLSPQEQEKVRVAEARRQVLHLAGLFYEERLWSPAGDAAREYLHSRGFTDDGIRDLRLGLIGPVSELRSHLLEAGCRGADVNHTGVLWPNLTGHIAFPWSDPLGRDLTIYGRWPGDPPEGLPKTIALPGEGTKRSPLYFDRARSARHKDLVLVEGVLDAAVAQARGETNVVACVAAQLSQLQVETLVRYGVQSVIICLDPDKAGEAGVRSCLRSLEATGIQAFVAPQLPDGQDPDEFLIERGTEAWNEHLAGAVHGYQFEADYLVRQHQPRSGQWTDRALAALLKSAKVFAAQKGEEMAPDLQSFFWPAIEAATGGKVTGPAGPSPGDRKEAATVPGRRLILRQASEVERTRVEWLWQRWLPLGKITAFDGDPGLGKSLLSLELAARVSRGLPMPDGSKSLLEPRDVVLVFAEDGASDTVVPRLIAAGADMKRVHFLEGVIFIDADGVAVDEPIYLNSIRDFREAIEDTKAALMVVDPFAAHVPDGVDSHNDAEVRRLMRPLKDLAEVTRCSSLLIRHLNKAPGGKAIYRGGGSIGIIAAARSALLAGLDPDDDSRKILAVSKCNLSEPPPSWAYETEKVADPDGDPAGVPRIKWLEETALTANDLVISPPRQRTGETAEALLLALLSRGPRPSGEVEAAAQAAGVSERTLNRARQKLGVTAKKEPGAGNGWVLHLNGSEQVS